MPLSSDYSVPALLILVLLQVDLGSLLDICTHQRVFQCEVEANLELVLSLDQIEQPLSVLGRRKLLV